MVRSHGKVRSHLIARERRYNDRLYLQLTVTGFCKPFPDLLCSLDQLSQLVLCIQQAKSAFNNNDVALRCHCNDIWTSLKFWYASITKR